MCKGVDCNDDDHGVDDLVSCVYGLRQLCRGCEHVGSVVRARRMTLSVFCAASRRKCRRRFRPRHRGRAEHHHWCRCCVLRKPGVPAHPGSWPWCFSGCYDVRSLFVLCLHVLCSDLLSTSLHNIAQWSVAGANVLTTITLQVCCLRGDLHAERSAGTC